MQERGNSGTRRVVLTVVLATILVAAAVSLAVLWNLAQDKRFPTEDELVAGFTEKREALEELQRLVVAERDRIDAPLKVVAARDEGPIAERLRTLDLFAVDTALAPADPCVGYVATTLYGTYMAYAKCDATPRYLVDEGVLEAAATETIEKGRSFYRPLADGWYLTVRR